MNALPSVTGRKILIVNTWKNNFNAAYSGYFSRRNEVRVHVSDQFDAASQQQLLAQAEWADLVWTQWASIPLYLLARQELRATLVTYVRSYEILTDLFRDIRWSKVAATLFCADHIRDLANRLWKDQLQGVPQATFYNCVDVDAYPFHRQSPGPNIAFIGYLGHKKGVGLLVQCIQAAAAKDPSYRFHIAGSFQDRRFEIYFKHAIRSLGLEDKVRLHGWVKDVPAFLADMRYVISTSPWEGCPNNVIESLACGVKPLVHNWNGAAGLYPPELVFNTVGEFVDRLVSADYQSEQYRDLARRQFEISRVLPAMDAYLASLPIPSSGQGRIQVASAPGPRIQEEPSPALFDPRPEKRLQAMLRMASDRLAAGDRNGAQSVLEKAVRMNGYRSQDIVAALADIHRERQDIAALKGLWKRVAVAGLQAGDLDSFLESAYTSIYAESYYSRSPNYRFSWIDEDLNAYVRMAAQSHPLRQAGAANRRRFTPHADGRLRIGFVLEGLSRNQSTIRNYQPLIRFADPSAAGVWVFSRWSLKEPVAVKEGHAETADEWRRLGATVVHPGEPLSPSAQLDFLAREIIRARIDILVFQTTYFVPVHNFLAALRLAPFQAAIEHQQPEFVRDMDLVFTTRKQTLECPVEIAAFPISLFRSDVPGKGLDRKEFGLPADALVLVSANREVRYSQETFWRQLRAVLERHPNAWFLALGLSGKERLPDPGDPAWNRVVAPGYRRDVPECLALADLYIDLFPSGGGSSLVEAMRAGLPVIGFHQDLAAPYTILDETLAPEYVGEGRLLVPHGDMPAWQTLVDRALNDRGFRASMADIMRERAEAFRPEKVAERFHAELADAYRRKRDQAG